MKVIMIGCVHHSLVCQENLESIFATLKETHPNPSFIAVEYDESIFKSFIVPQRDALDACKERNAVFAEHLTDSEMSRIAQAVGYDGDAHISLFADTKTIWLDSGREADFQNMPCSGIVYSKIADVAGKVMKDVISREKGCLIEQYKKVELEETPSIVDLDRDKRWATLLEEFLDMDTARYAFVVVGADHTIDKEGMLRQLIRKLGHKIEVAMAYQFCKNRS